MTPPRRLATLRSVRDALVRLETALTAPLPRSIDGARKHADRIDKAREALLAAVRDYGTMTDERG